MDKKNPFNCAHSGMFRDQKVGQFFSNIIVSNEKSYSEQYENFIKNFD